MTKRSFYRSKIVVEVLHEDARALTGDIDLADVTGKIVSAGCTGWWNVVRGPVKVTARRVARYLIENGSDPGLLGLDEKGNDAS